MPDSKSPTTVEAETRPAVKVRQVWRPKKGLCWAHKSSPAWDGAWVALSRQIVADGIGDGSDLIQEHPVLGEGWQYMGSSLAGDGMAHDFRHRCHPSTEVREYRTVRTTVLPTSPEEDDA